MTAHDGDASANSNDASIGGANAILPEQLSISLCKHLIRQESVNHDSRSRLENLPPELRVAVLCCMPDLETVHSFIQASPVLYSQYRNDRDLILRNTLHRQLDSLLPDAIGTLISRPSVLKSPRSNAKIYDVLRKYKSWLSAPSTSPSILTLDMSAVHWLAQFHMHIAIPLSQEFSRWAMLNLSKEASFNSPAINAAVDNGFSLSQPEQCRVMRAIYRTQIYHHLFGNNEARRGNMLRYDVIQEIYFRLFNPWETETIASFDLYSRDFYRKIFDEIAEDIHPDNPRYFNEDDGWRIIVEGWDFEYQDNGNLHNSGSKKRQYHELTSVARLYGRCDILRS